MWDTEIYVAETSDRTANWNSSRIWKKDLFSPAQETELSSLLRTRTERLSDDWHQGAADCTQVCRQEWYHQVLHYVRQCRTLLAAET